MDERKLIYADDAIRWIKTESNPYGKPTLDFESGKKVIAYLERMPSVQPMDVQEAYYRGKIDGIKECTTRIKKMNEEFANGRHDLQTSGDRCAEPTS